jgi:hypothetical protein
MKKLILRLLLPAIILAAFIIGLCPPPSSGHASPAWKASPVFSLAQNKKDDDPPWDPGDERPAGPFTNAAGENMKGRGRGDHPWDPGDESGHSLGVRDA